MRKGPCYRENGGQVRALRSRKTLCAIDELTGKVWPVTQEQILTAQIHIQSMKLLPLRPKEFSCLLKLLKTLKPRMTSCLQASSSSSSMDSRTHLLDLPGLFQKVSKVWLVPVQGLIKFFYCDWWKKTLISLPKNQFIFSPLAFLSSFQSSQTPQSMFIALHRYDILLVYIDYLILLVEISAETG